MNKKDTANSKTFNRFLYGGDYNPDQWLETPEIFQEDIRLMKLANITCMTLGIFSWSNLELEEGKFEFGWLDNIINKLHENGISVILATPSGARPAWLSEKYPEVLRVQANRVRNLHGQRHNHCYTSPVYREKVSIINRKLAERYKDHPALIMWHISNEYGGECHCEYCQEAFRNWLKQKYDNDLDKLNHSWWTGFWSHKYTSWSQIESPAPHGECFVHGHNLDWKRFVTHQTIDFYKNEIKPLRELTPNIPITTNFMGNGYSDKADFNIYEGLDYWKFAEEVDVVSYDSYPFWHNNAKKTWELAAGVSFVYDLNRCYKEGQPFYLMESTPSQVNWHRVNKLKSPGLNFLASLQAVAHGSDSVLYFQWRKGRGASEKLHGAVVDHCGHENTRVFREVAELGGALKKIDCIIGTSVKPEVAIIFDMENNWAINDLQGMRMDKKEYQNTCVNHYKPFWKKGIPVDIINEEADFTKYKLLIAPMLYMVKPGVAERIEEFVKNGGIFVTTYSSGIVDENDLCYLGGFPGPLRKVLGIWSEEIDALYDGEKTTVAFTENNRLGLKGNYDAEEICELIHLEGAESIANYEEDFYVGRPALTVNNFGEGKAYYIASRNIGDFNDNFLERIIEELNLKGALDSELPEGVTAQMRTDGEYEYVFIMNFGDNEQTIMLDCCNYLDLITNSEINEKVSIPQYGLRILKRCAK